tara:strand:- start:344 stop:814 length:471 start_codon:yes stop_codon:yes gene_type:complete
MSIKLSGFDLDRELEALIYLDIPQKEFDHRIIMLRKTDRKMHLKHCVYYVSGIFWKRSYDFHEELTLDDESVYKKRLQQKIIPYINNYYDSIQHKPHNDIINGLNEIYEFAESKVRCPNVGRYLDFIHQLTPFGHFEKALLRPDMSIEVTSYYEIS